MKVLQLEVGPIVGETTPTRAKVFGSGARPPVNGSIRRAHLVARYRPAGKTQWQRVLYYKLNPNFDMSAVAVFEGLQANHAYEYQVGYIYSEIDSSEIDVENVLLWTDIPLCQFKTAASNKTAARSIVTGSCRYILRLFGGSWFDDRGDKTFRSILEQNTSKPIDLILMSGDQIYADDLNLVGADSGVDAFLKRYRLAFSQPHISKLMASIPTLMTLDDHEIEDNWPGSASPGDMVAKFPNAMHAYKIYQASHSPLTPVAAGRIGSADEHLWYTHQDGCCDLFVTDSRTQRHLDSAKRIMSVNQMNALKSWLNDGSGRVKIIVTSVPPWESESDDKWHGFIDQRDELIYWIRQQ